MYVNVLQRKEKRKPQYKGSSLFNNMDRAEEGLPRREVVLPHRSPAQ